MTRRKILAFAITAILAFGIPVSPDCHAQSFHKATAPAPAAGSMFVYPERIPLKEGGFFTCQRGWLFAPLVRSQADSDVISVEFYQFPRSAAADPDTPPIFILNGGPGFPGLQKALERKGSFENEFQELLDVSDVIVVGQRGIGSSKPDTVIEQEIAAQPADVPRDDAQATASFQESLQQQRQFWIDQGVDLGGFNVEECATDVRDIARGLGYDQITIMGGSFGSHWGMTLMRSHPDLVARAVLHGMEGPDHTWDHPGWIWNVYRRVAEDAEQSEKLREFIPEGGLIAAVESLVQRFEAEPLTVILNEGEEDEFRVLIDGPAMRRLARGFSGSLGAWPADVIQMSRGQFEQPARMLHLRSRRNRRQTTTASYWMLDSGSGITARRRAEFESDPAMQVIESTFWSYAAGSPVWQTDLGDEFRQNFHTEIPTVIVHGTWDTSTPWENAQELAPYFGNSRFITVHRGSHGALREAARADESFRPALWQFVVDGDMSGLPDEITLPVRFWKKPRLDEDDD